MIATSPIVYCLDIGNGLFKIGFTRNPSERFRAIERTEGRAVPVAFFETKGRLRRRVEQYLHRVFADCQVRPEVFRLSDDDVSLLQSIPDVVSKEADLPRELVERHSRIRSAF